MKKLLSLVICFLSISISYGQSGKKEAYFKSFQQAVSRNLLDTIRQTNNYRDTCITLVTYIRFSLNTIGQADTIAFSRNTPSVFVTTIKQIVEKVTIDLSKKKLCTFSKSGEVFILPLFMSITDYDCKSAITTETTRADFSNLFTFPGFTSRNYIKGNLLSPIEVFIGTAR